MPARTTTKPVDNNIPISKNEFPASQLMIAIFFSTYFLTVQTIELSLSNYVLEDNQLELYRKYLIFKHHDGSIWKWWQLFSSLTIPLSVFSSLRELVEILTKTNSIKQHFIHIITALQLFAVLYLVFTQALPLENKFMEITSKETMEKLNSFQWIVFLLNIIGWFLPIIRYRHSNGGEDVHKDKKTQ